MIVTNDKRREVAAKVRETMGALGQCELDGIPLADLIEPTECDECSTPNRFEELTAEIHEEYENLADALDRRLMPEGMEWPRFEDDEPVSFGSLFENADGEPEEAGVVSFTAEGARLKSLYGTEYGTFYRYGERVKRPPVLAADGEPLEVGQTVWRIDTGAEYWVKSGQTITSDAVVIIRKTDCDCESEIVKASQLTHQCPVLDADGVPIKEGDTVYLLPGEWCGEYPLINYSAGDEMVVKELCPDHKVEGVLKCVGDGKCTCFPLPYQLTHTKPEPPDSWDRVEDDATLPPTTYCERVGIAVEQGDSFVEPMARDLVRRCRALAERERSE